MSGRQSHKNPRSDSSRTGSLTGSRAGDAPPGASTAPSVDGTGTTAEISEPQPRAQSLGQPFFRVPQSPRSSVESQSKIAKVAIPRLKRTIDAANEGSSRSGGRHRVNHACEPCRHRKTKCSGERPVCRHCQDFKIVCFYADGKRDRVKKQFGSMTEKVAEYERLLKDLANRVSDADSNLIKATLDKTAQDDVDETRTDAGTAPSVEVDAETEASGAESEVSAGVGSMGAMDRTDEDFTREGARLTGFMGKNSDVTWLQRLRQENNSGDPPPENASDETQRLHNISASMIQSKYDSSDFNEPLAETVEGFSLHESNYHLDDLAISTFEAIDPYEMPPPETAELLFNTYMQRMHPSFPVVGKVNLLSQFRKFMSNPGQRPPEKWLAIVNLILALGAKYSHLVQAEWRGDERDHIMYFNRARILAFNNETAFEHPNLQLIQIFGLMSLYLMCISQMNRAWLMVGSAIRYAVALGLNMRNDSVNLKDSLKEIRYRLWWALFALEDHLCSITGRVNSVLNSDCATPLPVPIEEEKFDTEEGHRLLSKESQQGERAPSSNSHSSNVTSPSLYKEGSRSSGLSERSRSPSTMQTTSQNELQWAKDAQPSSSLYFLHMVQLMRLSQTIYRRLYNPTALDQTWSSVQSKIQQSNDELENWYRRLPAVLDFRRRQRDREFYEFRLNLGFSYYSTKQIVFRPCLCRFDRKMPKQSDKSREFNRSSAASCVEAAQEMLRLIPDEPNPIGLIRVGPWWAILPRLVQSASVLMLEISFRARHMPEDIDSIFESSKKAVRWLHALGEGSQSAQRAWRICNKMLHEASSKVGRQLNDLPTKSLGPESESSSANMTSMSGTSGDNTQNLANHDAPNSMYGAGNVDGPDSMSFYNHFSGYDQTMQFGQFFTTTNSMDMSMAGISNANFSTASPMDADMDFMNNPYLDNREDHHEH